MERLLSICMSYRAALAGVPGARRPWVNLIRVV